MNHSNIRSRLSIIIIKVCKKYCLINARNSLLRKKLWLAKFCTVCCSAQYFVYIKRIEKVQHRFANHFECRFNNINLILSLLSLEKRRFLLHISFALKVLNIINGCPEILFKVNFQIPSYRSNVLLSLPLNKNNSAYDSPINRLSLMVAFCVNL